MSVDSAYKHHVFVSHNRHNKPWVREAVAQWRTLGLSVFFDEDSVQPGEDVVTAIENALEASRYIVLVMTPESMRSNWIALEAALTVYADTDASRQRLIPIMLEPVEPQSIRLSIRRLARVDLTQDFKRRDEYHRLLKLFRDDATNLPDPPAVGPSPPAPAPAPPKIPFIAPTAETGGLDAPGLSVVLEHQLARESGGGDYVDLIPTHDGRSLLVIADVAGHGPAEAIVAAGLRGFIRAGVQAAWPLRDLMPRLNEFFIANYPQSPFVTLAMTLIDPKTGGCETVLAGHISPFVIGADGSSRQLKAFRDYPLGIAGSLWTVEQDQLLENQLLVMMTDGSMEALEAASGGAGEAHLGKLLGHACKQVGTTSPIQIAPVLRQLIRQSPLDPVFADDATLLLVARERKATAPSRIDPPEQKPAKTTPAPASTIFDLRLDRDVAVFTFTRANALYDPLCISQVAAAMDHNCQVLDCKGFAISLLSIEFASSAGMGIFITMRKRLLERKMRLSLAVRPDSRLFAAFQITRVTRLIPVCATIEEAIECVQHELPMSDPRLLK